MARLNVQVAMLVALAAVIVFSSPAMAARSGYIRQPVDKHHYIHHSHRPGSNMCIPNLARLLQDHEGRHKKAYDHENGYRAVGVGYNMDDEVEQRKMEMAAMGVDYDEVYRGDASLNDMQIAGLLFMDAKRALDRAAENVKNVDDFCCAVRAVIADIQHSSGSADKFPQRDLEKFIEKAGREQYESAANELGKTEWCAQEANTVRCDDNMDRVARGC